LHVSRERERERERDRERERERERERPTSLKEEEKHLRASESHFVDPTKEIDFFSKKRGRKTLTRV
jgi:hypothetical protein